MFTDNPDYDKNDRPYAGEDDSPPEDSGDTADDQSDDESEDKVSSTDG